MPDAVLGTITITLSCETVVLDDGAGGEQSVNAGSPPKLAVQLDLPVPQDKAPALAVQYLRRVADQLEAGDYQ